MLESIEKARLDKQEKMALEYALSDIRDEAYLFGSRIDPNKKGGDIDLLIYSQADPLRLSRRIVLKFFEKCEEKIDVIVMDRDNLSEDQQSFLNTISTLRIR